jgi:hypothetical protein
MNIKEDLEILLFTFSRLPFLKRTMEALLSEESPVKNCIIKVFNNNSKDGTTEYLNDIDKKYQNVQHIKNKYNISVGTQIKGLDTVEKKYFWMLADDDVYDWTNWSEVEHAMKQNEKIICVADYCIHDKTKMEQVLQQLTFYPAAIFNSSLLTDELMVNFAMNIDTLFPQFAFICDHLNNGGQIYICDKWIINNGMIVDEKNPERDMTYSRCCNADKLCNKYKNLSWGVGYANALSMLKDKKLKHKAMEIAQTFQDMTFRQYMKNEISKCIFKKEKWFHIGMIYEQLSLWQKFRLIFIFLEFFLDIFVKIRKDTNGKTLILFSKLKLKIKRDL